MFISSITVSNNGCYLNQTCVACIMCAKDLLLTYYYLHIFVDCNNYSIYVL